MSKTADSEDEQVDNIEKWRIVWFVDLCVQRTLLGTLVQVWDFMTYDINQGVRKRDAKRRGKQREVRQVTWVPNETALNKIREG